MEPLLHSQDAHDFATISVADALAGSIHAWARVGTAPITVICQQSEAPQDTPQIRKAVALLARSPRTGLVWNDTDESFIAVKAPYLFELHCFDQSLDATNYPAAIYERLLGCRITNGVRIGGRTTSNPQAG